MDITIIETIAKYGMRVLEAAPALISNIEKTIETVKTDTDVAGMLKDGAEGFVTALETLAQKVL